MSTIGTIIFLLVIAWQVISQVVAQSKKKELEEQRSTGAAQRARRVQGQSAASSGPNRADSAEQARLAPPTLRSGGASAQDLAARRRAQLEELRSRRQNRGAPGAGQSGPVTPPRATGPRTIETIDLDFADQQRAEAERKRLQDRADEQLQKQQEVERARRQREAVQAHRHQETQLTPVAPTRPKRAEPHHATEHSDVHRLVEDAGGAAISDSTLREQSQARNLARIRGRLQTKRDLRDLFILRELIEPPVSLRRPPEIG